MAARRERELVARLAPGAATAARPQRETQRHLVRDMVNRAFAGSSASLVMQALSDRKATPDELAEIRALVEKLERKDK